MRTESSDGIGEHMLSNIKAPLNVFVRPGAAGLLIDIQCSRVRNITWMYFTSLVTTRIGVELAAVQRNYSTIL